MLVPQFLKKGKFCYLSTLNSSSFYTAQATRKAGHDCPPGEAREEEDLLLHRAADSTGTQLEATGTQGSQCKVAEGEKYAMSVLPKLKEQTRKAEPEQLERHLGGSGSRTQWHMGRAQRRGEPGLQLKGPGRGELRSRSGCLRVYMYGGKGI